MNFYVVEIDNEGFKIYDSSGSVIDPAQDSTVASVVSELQAIQSTTGIKAIIDPLPAGANTIGGVDIVSSIPAGSNIIGLVKLVDSAGINVIAIDASGRLAIQDQPNMDVLLSTRSTESSLSGFRSDYNDKVGEVSPTPTVNTVLDRLKVINDTLQSEDFASETTLSTLFTEATGLIIQSILEDIRDVAGIKKITDQLPVGSNLLGKVNIRNPGDTVDLGDDTNPVRVDPTGVTTQPVSDAGGSITIDSPQLPLSLVGGRLDENVGSWMGSTSPTIGQKLMTNSLPVVVASDQTEFPVSQGTKGLGANGWPIVIYDDLGNPVTITEDAGTYRLNIVGKVTVTGATAPPATNSAIITADTPLIVGAHDTTYVIPDGELFHLQEIVAGNEDPTKGASVTVIYYDGTEHVVARVYISGHTRTVGYPDRSTARDGTSMIGNVGGTNTIIVRRSKFSGSDIAIDAIARGYTV